MDKFQERMIDQIIKFANVIKQENGKEMETYIDCIQIALNKLKEHPQEA